MGDDGLINSNRVVDFAMTRADDEARVRIESALYLLLEERDCLLASLNARTSIIDRNIEELKRLLRRMD